MASLAHPAAPPRASYTLLAERCALLGLLPLAAVDQLLLVGHGASWRLRLTALVTLLFVAALVAALWRALAWLLEPVRHPWQRAAALATFGSPAMVAVAVLLFRGTGISQKSWAAAGPFVMTPLLWLGALCGVRLLTALGRWLRPRPRRQRVLLAGLPLALAMGALIWADRQLYPNQYGYLHHTLLAFTVLAGLALGWVLLVDFRPRRRAIAPWLLSAALPAAVVGALWGVSGQLEQQRLDSHTHVMGRVAELGRWITDRDGDGHALLFGGADCDDRDPAVHPFAPELPGNGVDEDCDGRDEAPEAETKRSAAGAAKSDGGAGRERELIDMPTYRQRLAAWRKGRRSAEQRQRLERANVLLIVVDALRADELQRCVARGHCPAIAKLSKSPGARVFTRAFSHGAGTDIGMSTLFTGQQNPMARARRTMAQAFYRAGYHTYAVFQREVDRWLGKVLPPKLGLRDWHPVVNDPWREDYGSRATSKEVSDRGIAYLQRRAKLIERAARNQGRRKPRPFFAWLHYFDVHEHRELAANKLLTGVAAGHDAYRHLLRHVDGHIGRVLDALDSQPALARTVVVFAADHGEGLAETPRLPRYHGDVLYQQLVHVPLILRIPPSALSPAASKPRRVEQAVGLSDVAPTVVDLVGRRKTLPRATGLSLLPLLLGASPPPYRIERPIALYEEKQRGLVVWPWKLLVWKRKGLVELYHLERDPREQRNLVEAEGRRVRAMVRRLARHRLPDIDRRAAARRAAAEAKAAEAKAAEAKKTTHP